jgi:hypothetical protein
MNTLTDELWHMRVLVVGTFESQHVHAIQSAIQGRFKVNIGGMQERFHLCIAGNDLACCLAIVVVYVLLAARRLTPYLSYKCRPNRLVIRLPKSLDRIDL